MSGTLRPGPQIALLETGALDALPDLLLADGIRSVLFIHGTKSLRAASAYLPALNEHGIRVVDASFRGECSPGEIERLRVLGEAEGVGAVIGLGGGKILDAAKAVAFGAGRLPAFLVPTLASTCSAWSAVSVYYDDDHHHLGHDVWPVPTRAVLIDPRIIFDSPVDFFVSGIADTLAKWVETRPLFERHTSWNTFDSLAATTARQCRDVPFEDGSAAVDDMRAGRLSAQWQAVMETSIISAGLVGGFGGERGRATAAHPVSDGLSALAQTRDLLHGIKVAYGILVQLALEGRWDDISSLRSLFGALGLPRSLADVQVDVNDVVALRAIADIAVDSSSSIHLLEENLSADRVVAAMTELEAFQEGLTPVAVTGRDTAE